MPKAGTATSRPHYTGTSTTGYVSLFRKDEVNMGIVATFYHPVAVFLKEEESCSTIT